MAAGKLTVECTECGEKDNFQDAKDVTYAHWKIIAWDVDKNMPICLCPECEYGKPKKKVK